VIDLHSFISSTVRHREMDDPPNVARRKLPSRTERISSRTARDGRYVPPAPLGLDVDLTHHPDFEGGPESDLVPPSYRGLKSGLKNPQYISGVAEVEEQEKDHYEATSSLEKVVAVVDVKNEPVSRLPGTASGRNPAPTSSSYYSEDDDELSPSVRPRARLELDQAAARGLAPLVEDPAVAYVVQEYDTDDNNNIMEKVQNEILANAAEAVVVTPGDVKSVSPRRRRLYILCAILVMGVAVAVAVGVAVPLTTRQDSISSPTPAPEDDVIASLTYRELREEGGFASAIYAETRSLSLFGAATSTGSFGVVHCRIKTCVINGTSCVTGRDYVPGCCLGRNCTNEDKCGDRCPKPPVSCYLTKPDNVTCTQSECYTCTEDVYQLSDFVFNIDCLQAGTSIRKSNGQRYKWAIFCGPVVQGARPDLNQGVGEYQCAAARLGAGYADDNDGIRTEFLSCQYVALAECGCGPADMNTFQLPPPAEACPDNGTCPFRCEDSGSGETLKLCSSYPGNLTWWEGRNVFKQSLFLEGLAAPNYALSIYIRDESS
jgi:hypothetical protein